MTGRDVGMRTLHRLGRLLKGKRFLAEDKFAILELDQRSLVYPHESVHERNTARIKRRLTSRRLLVRHA